ncbi:MAG: hypothetical protein R3D67_10725 [Hyphomicrobiaceae bacterium]
MGLADVHEDELYDGMDWLIQRQGAIAKRLRLQPRPQARHAASELGPADRRTRRPVAVSVFDGNTDDPEKLLPQVETVKKNFGLASLVMVGDRGMISNADRGDARDGRHRLDHRKKAAQ